MAVQLLADLFLYLQMVDLLEMLTELAWDLLMAVQLLADLLLD